MTALLTAIAIATAPTARPAPQPHIDVETRQAVPRKWIQIAACESDLHWHINSGNGYSSGLQFTAQTWSAFRPDGFPEQAWQATAVEQVAVAERVLAAQGWGAWPTCSRRVGLR